MSKSIIGKQQSAKLAEIQKGEVVRSRRATSDTDTFLEDVSVDSKSAKDPSKESHLKRKVKKQSSSKKKKADLSSTKPKPRFGLPEGFTPRSLQHGRSVLLEGNVYTLPGGRELIPKHPSGTLGKLSHLYALLTVEQFEVGRRGSVYVRTDGRIFDYSVDHGDPSRDMFDTGYTIYDLERTGRYARESESKSGKNEDQKPRRMAQAG